MSVLYGAATLATLCSRPPLLCKVALGIKARTWVSVTEARANRNERFEGGADEADGKTFALAG